jgi:hypothetical protein
MIFHFLVALIIFFTPSYQVLAVQKAQPAGYIVSYQNLGSFKDQTSVMNILPFFASPITDTDVDKQNSLIIHANEYFNPNDFNIVFNKFVDPQIRAEISFEYGVGLDDEGPHLELTKWKTCTGKKVSMVTNSEFLIGYNRTFVFKEKEENFASCTPKFTKAELLNAIEIHLSDNNKTPSNFEEIKRWSDIAESCYQGQDKESFFCSRLLILNVKFFLPDGVNVDKKIIPQPLSIVLMNGC